MADLRQRKPNASGDPTSSDPTTTNSTVDNDPPKKKPQDSDSDSGALPAALGILTTLALTVGAIFGLIYFLDPLQEAPEPLQTFTAQTLRPHDGSDPSLPLLLALNGSVYDVSSARPFYAPGGPYAAFAGRDATRAWVTQCFGAEEDEAQLIPDLSGVEAMFLPLWLDEAFADAAAGEPVAADAAALFGAVGTPEGAVLPEAVRAQARKVVERMGGVGGEERRERRGEDEREAREKVREVVGRWEGWLGGKYPVVGVMEREEGVGEVPGLCEKARGKRPVKGGRLEGMLGMLEKMKGGEREEMPEFVEHMLRNQGKK